MGNDYKKQVLAKAKQNRTNKVTKTNKYYGNKTSKSQKDFIAGDVVSSASNKAYGYKTYGLPEQSYITGGRSASNYKAIQEGKDPYKLQYVYDGKKRTVKNDDGSTFTSRKRFLTDDEKEAYKTTGSTNVSDYKKNYKYAILRGADSDGKNFNSHFNLLDKNGKMKWDGMNVAKNKVKNGGSKLNYVGGFLKDTVVDAGVDFLKTFDRYESGAMGGLLGVAENTQDVVDSVTSGDFSFKNVDLGRIKKNWNESIEESNKTGFGHSAGHYLKGMSQRNDDQMYESILKSSGQEKADEYRKTEQKVQGVENVANTVTGLGLDFLNPAQIGSAFAKTLGFAGENTIKTGKDLFKGTGDISTGFKSGGVLDVLTNQGPLAKTNKRGSMLNQEYDRVMSKAEQVKDVVKSNPKTQNLGHFLDEIGESVDSGVQRSFDGRTLNNKYTQVADDYVPQTIRGEGEVDNIVNNNKSNQLSFNSSKNLNNKYDKLYKSHNNEDELFDAIDELDSRSSDEFLDWLKNNNPSTYQKYTGTADELDEFANQGIQVNRLSERRDESLVNSFNKNAQTVSTKPKYNYKKIDNVTEENAIEKMASLFDKQAPKTFKNNYERKHVFENSIRDLSKNIQEGKLDAEDISNTIQKVKGEGVPTRLKREYINNKLFNGDNVLASNVSGKSLDGLLDSVEDLINLKKVSSEYMQTGEVLSVKLSDATKKFLKVDDNLKIVGSKVRGNKIESPEDLVETLNKSIVDRARALTDERYGDKLQLMANEFGYKNYDDITTSLDNLIAKRKELDKIPSTSLDEKLEVSANIKRLKEIVSKRTDMWEKIKNLPESDFDKLVNEKYPHHIENLNSYGNKVNQRKEMQQLSKLDEFTKLLDETADATNNRKLTIDDFYNEVAEEIKGTQKLKDYIEEGGNVDELIESQARIRYNDYRNEQGSYKLKQNIDNRNATITEASNMDRVLSESPRLEQENLSDVGEIVDDIASRSEIIYKDLKLNKPKINKSNIKLSNGQKLGHLPPVKENSAGLKRVIQHEMEMMYKEPKKYLEYKDSFKQIKKEYVNSMRSYGVKDSSYFEKVKNLQDDLDLYYKELNKPTSIINKSSEGGPGTPKNGMNMNLQLLAKKIEDTFSEFDENIAKEFGETLKGKQLNIDGRTLNKKRTQTKDGYVPQMLRNSDDVDDVVKNANESEQLSIFDEISSNTPVTHLKGSDGVSNTPVDKLINNTVDVSKNPLDEFVNSFDEFNQFDNIKKATKETTESVPKKSQKPSNEKIDEILERYKDHGNSEKFDDVDDFDAFRSSFDGKTQSEIDKFINANDPSKPSTFEKFKKFFTEKSQDTKVGYEEGGLYKAYKAWLNSYKKGLTVYNPGWHVQNFFQNKGQNYLALGPQALTSQKNARNVLNYINGADKGAYELTSKSGKTYTKRELANLAKKYNVAEGMATNTTKSNGIAPWLEGKADNSSIMKKALQSEQTARLHHFLTQLERGMSPEEASKSVNKYLFDYGSKTKADKMMSDFVDPFWSFHKSNAKMLTTAPFKHPSEVNNILRANRGLDDDVKDDEKVPNSFREHQLPFGSFKDEMNGDNYNYFYDENMMPDVSKALPLESSELENKMNPLLRIALQQSKNEGNFGNKIVDKDKSGYNEVTKSERGGEIATELNPLMNPLVKAYMDSQKHQKKTDDGKQTQSTTDIQKLMELVAYITGNKGAYYRDTR